MIKSIITNFKTLPGKTHHKQSQNTNEKSRKNIFEPHAIDKRTISLTMTSENKRIEKRQEYISSRGKNGEKTEI